jgi:hypothetical protein
MRFYRWGTALLRKLLDVGGNDEGRNLRKIDSSLLRPSTELGYGSRIDSPRAWVSDVGGEELQKSKRGSFAGSANHLGRPARRNCQQITAGTVRTILRQKLWELVLVHTSIMPQRW